MPSPVRPQHSKACKGKHKSKGKQNKRPSKGLRAKKSKVAREKALRNRLNKKAIAAF
jgi:hypothetical protein